MTEQAQSVGGAVLDTPQASTVAVADSPQVVRAGSRAWTPEDSIDPLDSFLNPIIHNVKGPDGLTDWEKIARNAERQAVLRAACQTDPWFWLVNFAVTMDEHWVSKGGVTAYMRFPPKRYLQAACHLLLHEPMTAWPKSRQVMASWLVVSYVLGDAQFTGGRLYLLQSKKESDAAALLRRLRGVYLRQRSMAPWLGPKLVTDNETRLEWDNGSVVVAAPQGAHEVQSHTPSWVVLDEVQLQDQAQEAFYQALPASEHITLLGTPDYGWFCQDFLADRRPGER